MKVTPNPGGIAYVVLTDADGCSKSYAELGRIGPEQEPKLNYGVTSRMASIYADMLEENTRQEQKWGEQSHPSVDQTLLTRPGGCTALRMCQEYEIPSAATARMLVEQRSREGGLTWAHIALEEFAEAVECLDDEQRMRTELVQLGAVIGCWIESIDRRAAVPVQSPEPTEG